MPVERQFFLGQVEDLDLKSVARPSLNGRAGKLIYDYCQSRSCDRRERMFVRTIYEKSCLSDTVGSYCCLRNVPREVSDARVTRHMVFRME